LPIANWSQFQSAIDYRQLAIFGACMKLNFWQWLGVALLVVGLVLALNKYAFHWW
jgi:hypothetical protein